MKSNISLCVIGGYDPLARAYFKYLKKEYKSTCFINLLNNNFTEKGLYNFKIYQLKKILDLLKYKKVNEIIFLGKITRPNLTEFIKDGIIENYIPLLLSAYKSGDGAVLDTVINIFKEQNYKIVSPLKYSNEFTLIEDHINVNYDSEDDIDIKKSSDLLNELSKYDNAQSVVSINGYIIAIEAAEGTDALLRRVRSVRKDLGQLGNKSGFFTKKPKKNQSKLIDLPVVGPTTIKLIKRANLKGLAIDFSNTMIYKKKEVLKLINEFNLTICNVN
tara:strand:- start:412 stop:1233 length:822 start_codon:yes stop_codon:yes gene_type:complete